MNGEYFGVVGNKVKMKGSISKISLIAYAFMLILTGFILTTSEGLIILFLITGAFAIPAILAGPKRYRIIGIAALLIAIAAAMIEYKWACL